MGVYGTISILFPELTVNIYQYQEYLNGNLTEEQYQNLLIGSSKRALQRLITQSMILLIAIILWVIHWNIAKSKEQRP